MPCYQPSNLPSGVTTTGRTAYATEAECNEACKEGACCEGTTCTVKPQCQCQCTTGSCCGPDLYTNITGETGPKCRTESQADCAARGGTWRCGVPCRPVAYDAAAGYGLGSEICSSLDPSPSVAPVFKGVGTTCEGSPCGCCGNGETIAGKTATVFVSVDRMPTARWCPKVVGGTAFLQCPDGIQYGGCWAERPCVTPSIGEWVDTSSSASATFTSNATASNCSASLQGQCIAEARSASVGFSASPCKIYAIVDCPNLIAATASGSSVNPYWAWTFDPQASEYNALYYVFQYIDGTGANTVTQSVNSTPVNPSIPTGSSASWFLFKTVTVNMRLTLA